MSHSGSAGKVNAEMGCSAEAWCKDGGVARIAPQTRCSWRCGVAHIGKEGVGMNAAVEIWQQENAAPESSAMCRVLVAHS